MIFVKTSTIVTLLLLPSHLSAFAPLPPTTSRLQSTASLQASPTVLKASLIDRFFRVARSNLNNLASKVEDPEKVMTQAVVDMQNDLVKIRQSYAEATATLRRLKQQKKQSDAVASDWYDRAQLALKRDREDLAREALGRRQAFVQEGDGIQMQIDAQTTALDSLYEGMQTLESKILEAKSKQDNLAVRARTAKSTKQVNDMLSDLTGRVQGVLSSNSAAAFARMEEKVLAMEAAAEASSELRFIESSKEYLMTGKSDKSGTSVETQFKLLEQSDAVDKELMKLKKALSPASVPSKHVTSIPVKELEVVG